MSRDPLDPRPPRLAEWLVARRTAAAQREFLLGDLEEDFRELVTSRGRRNAWRWYWQQTARIFLTSFVRSPQNLPSLTARRRAVGTVLQDVRFALRVFRRAPAHTCVVLLTLGVGIAGTTAMLSVADAVLLRPLPYPDAEELVIITGRDESQRSSASSADTRVTYADVLRWQTLRHVFSHVGAIAYAASWTIDGPEAQALTGIAVSPDHFNVYGVPPAAGRLFTSGDARPGAAPVVVLGHDYWRTTLQGDPAVVGRQVKLLAARDYRTVIGRPPAAPGPPALFATVIGVAPRSVGKDVDFWVPLEAPADPNSLAMMSVVARLRPGATIESARQAVNDAATLQRPEPPDAPRSMQVLPLEHFEGAPTRVTVAVLAGASCLLLLMACLNGANLQFSRGSARYGEMQVRAALGAGRTRLLGQLMTESVLLAIIAGTLGIALTWLMLEWLVATLPISLANHPRAVEVNSVVLIASLVLSAVVGVLVGLWPALRLTRSARVPLNLARPAAAGGRRRGAVLVAAQVTLAVVLLAGTTLMIRTFERLHAVDLGFQPEGFLEMEVRLALPAREVGEWFYPAVLERIRSLPEVAAAGAVSRAARVAQDLRVEGGSRLVPQTRWPIREVLPGYFEAVGIRLIAGRLPTPADHTQKARILVASETAVRLLFGNEPAIGRRLVVDPRQPVAQELVGVVADVRRRGPRAAIEPELYSLHVPADRSTLALLLVVRPHEPTPSLPTTLRTLTSGLGPKILVPTIRTAEEAFAETITADRQRTLLLTILGLLGMVLALVGILATTAYAVTRRTQEIGIRMAVGAAPARVVRQIVRDAIWPIGIGLALGLGGALLSAQAIGSFLFETAPHDPVALGSAAIVLGLAGLLAAWLPAQRAARIDPVATLRRE